MTISYNRAHSLFITKFLPTTRQPEISLHTRLGCITGLISGATHLTKAALQPQAVFRSIGLYKWPVFPCGIDSGSDIQTLHFQLRAPTHTPAFIFRCMHAHPRDLLRTFVHKEGLQQSLHPPPQQQVGSLSQHDSTIAQYLPQSRQTHCLAIAAPALFTLQIKTDREYESPDWYLRA